MGQNLRLLAMDIAKQIFHIVGMDDAGKGVSDTTDIQEMFEDTNIHKTL